MLRSSVVILICLCWNNWVIGAREVHRVGPYILGADISWVQEDEANGAVFYDRGARGCAENFERSWV